MPDPAFYLDVLDTSDILTKELRGPILAMKASELLK